MSIDKTSDFFLDFQRFGNLKLLARESSEQASQSVAQQFEGLFVQQMLAAMRSAARIDENQHSSYMDTYMDMYDKQLAQTIAAQDRLGVAKLIMRQLPSGETGQQDSQAETVLSLPAAVAAKAGVQAEPATTVRAAANTAAAIVDKDTSAQTGTTSVVLGKVSDDDFAEVSKIEQANRRWTQPDRFVADIWPEAQNAARQLGVSPELLVAQAALETGWGKHTMKFEDGRSSFNLFGIKAGTDWTGAALHKASLEYSDGHLHSEVSRFRAYASPAHSLADYVDFIQSNPRYRAALAQVGDDQAYIRAIHKAGYATDPNYADKVIGIMRGESLQQSLAALDTGVTDHA